MSASEAQTTWLHRDSNLSELESDSRINKIGVLTRTACRKRRAFHAETELEIAAGNKLERKVSSKSIITVRKKSRIQTEDLTLGLIQQSEVPQPRWYKQNAIRCPNVVAGKDGIIRPGTGNASNNTRLNDAKAPKERTTVDQETNDLGLSRKDTKRNNPQSRSSNITAEEKRNSPYFKCELIRNKSRRDFDAGIPKGATINASNVPPLLISIEEPATVFDQISSSSEMVIDFNFGSGTQAFTHADFPISTNCDPSVAKSDRFLKWKETLMTANGPTDEKSALDLQYAMVADTDGDRALHIAVVHQDVLLVRQLSSLIRSVGVSVDMYNHMRQTPLHLAVILQNPHLCEALLEEGALAHTRDRNGNTALHLAIQYNTNECLLVLLRSKCAKDILNIRNYEGLSCLHLTIKKKNMLAAYYLVKAGCDIDTQEGKSGRTPLMNAVYSQHVDMVKILLKLGANVLASDYSGNNALNAATELNMKDLITLLETKMHCRNKF